MNFGGKTGIFADSLSNVQRVSGRRADWPGEKDVMKKLARAGSKGGATLAWAGGHAGIRMNEEVDALAGANKSHSENLSEKYRPGETPTSVKCRLKSFLRERRESGTNDGKLPAMKNGKLRDERFSAGWYNRCIPPCAASARVRRDRG